MYNNDWHNDLKKFSVTTAQRRLQGGRRNGILTGSNAPGRLRILRENTRLVQINKSRTQKFAAYDDAHGAVFPLFVFRRVRLFFRHQKVCVIRIKHGRSNFFITLCPLRNGRNFYVRRNRNEIRVNADFLISLLQQRP